MDVNDIKELKEYKEIIESIDALRAPKGMGLGYEGAISRVSDSIDGLINESSTCNFTKMVHSMLQISDALNDAKNYGSEADPDLGEFGSIGRVAGKIKQASVRIVDTILSNNCLCHDRR